MKFITFIAFALMAITSTVALARDPAVVDAINSREGLETGDISELETGNFTEIEGGTLTKRACKASKCNCVGFGAGLFCGDGKLKCAKGHVYECNSNGKKTCDYGPRASCKKCNKLKC